VSDKPAPGGSPWPVALWLLFSMATVAIVVAVVAQLLSTTLVLDLAALWPAVALALVVLPMALLRRGVWRWIPPAILLTWLLTGLALHLNAVSVLPSAVGDVEIDADPAEVGTAKLTAGPIDVLVVDFTGGDTLASVTMRRRGGGVAPAIATPLVGDGRAEIVLTERDDPGFFQFEGWQLSLGDVESWELDVAATSLEISTDGAEQVSIQASGAGSIALSSVQRESVLDVTGVFDISVPRGVGIVLDGEATTPNDWTRTERGLASPGDTQWTLVVAGDSRVTVSYRDP
jgi:hypothetical protein